MQTAMLFPRCGAVLQGDTRDAASALLPPCVAVSVGERSYSSGSGGACVCVCACVCMCVCLSVSQSVSHLIPMSLSCLHDLSAHVYFSLSSPVFSFVSCFISPLYLSHPSPFPSPVPPLPPPLCLSFVSFSDSEILHWGSKHRALSMRRNRF